MFLNLNLITQETKCVLLKCDNLLFLVVRVRKQQNNTSYILLKNIIQAIVLTAQ